MAQRHGMLPVPLDVSDRAAVLAAAATVRDELGGIDIAILNAGGVRPDGRDSLGLQTSSAVTST